MVTQKDIARRLGVSGSLVSHVLGGRGPRIGASAETIRRIEAEVARQGYQRSAVALALRGQSTRMLGVVVKDFEDPYLGHLVGELQRLARESGYALLLTGCEGGAKPTPVLAPLNRYPLEGILLAGSDVAGAWFGTFARQGIRGAQIGTGPRVTGMRRFGVDEAGGMALVTGHLVRWGHRRIAYACDASGAHGRRHVAFEASIRRAGLVPVNVAGWQAESKMDLERALQDRGGLAVQGVTAVVCARWRSV
jgi:LacI family transcriptional regulator